MNPDAFRKTLSLSFWVIDAAMPTPKSAADRKCRLCILPGRIEPTLIHCGVQTSTTSAMNSTAPLITIRLTTVTSNAATITNVVTKRSVWKARRMMTPARNDRAPWAPAATILSTD